MGFHMPLRLMVGVVVPHGCDQIVKVAELEDVVVAFRERFDADLGHVIGARLRDLLVLKAVG